MKENVYKLDNVDCANCALKLENSLNKLDGIVNSSMNYMLLKLRVSFEENVISEEEIENTIYKSLSDVIIVSKNNLPYENKNNDGFKRRLLFGRRK